MHHVHCTIPATIIATDMHLNVDSHFIAESNAQLNYYFIYIMDLISTHSWRLYTTIKPTVESLSAVNFISTKQQINETVTNGFECLKLLEFRISEPSSQLPKHTSIWCCGVTVVHTCQLCQYIWFVIWLHGKWVSIYIGLHVWQTTFKQFCGRTANMLSICRPFEHYWRISRANSITPVQLTTKLMHRIWALLTVN